MATDAKSGRTMRIDVALDEIGPAPGRPRPRTIKIRPRAEVRDPVADYNPLAGPEFQALLQSFYDGTIITDLNGTILDMNRRVAQLTGLPRAELLGEHAMGLLAGADEGLLETIRDTVESERHVLLQAYVLRDGEEDFPAEVAVNRLEVARHAYLCFFIRDVSLRKQAQQRLRVEHSAVQNAGTGIVITELNGSIRYVNPAFVRLWGSEDAEVVRGDDVREVFADKAEAERIVDVVLGGSTWEAEACARRCDGMHFYVAVSATANHDEDGTINGLVFSFMDVDARRQAEEALRRYQAELEQTVSERTEGLREAIRSLEKHNMEKTAFVSNVSHELRTPLTSIAYATDNLLDGVFGEVNDSVRTYLTMMNEDCKRLTGTVQDILDLSRLESNRFRLRRRKVPMGWLVRRCADSIQMLCEKKNQDLTVDVPPSSGFARCDQRRLERALGNVLQNAVKFTPEGGSIRLGVQHVDGAVEISVTDSGVGIPAEHLARVMDRYYRVGERVSGTGLGLSLCREIVELHGGSVTLESPPSGETLGTRVIVSIPVEEAPCIAVLARDGTVRDHFLDILEGVRYSVEVWNPEQRAIDVAATDSVDALVVDLSTCLGESLALLAETRHGEGEDAVGIVAVGGHGTQGIPTELLDAMHVPLVTAYDTNEVIEAIESAIFGSNHERK